jgi:hypothetical protein
MQDLLKATAFLWNFFLPNYFARNCGKFTFRNGKIVENRLTEGAN